MGSGKSTTADHLRYLIPGSVVLGICRLKWLVSGFVCTKKEYKIAGEVIMAMADCYLKHGKTLIIEQCFREKRLMKPYVDLSAKKKIPLAIYELQAPKSILLARIKQRPKPKLKINRLPWRKILDNIAAYPHSAFFPVRQEFDTSRLSTRKICNWIIKDISNL